MNTEKLEEPSEWGITDEDVRNLLSNIAGVEAVHSFSPVAKGVNIIYKTTVTYNGEQRTLFLKLGTMVASETDLKEESESLLFAAEHTDVSTPSPIEDQYGITGIGYPWIAMSRLPGDELSSDINSLSEKKLNDAVYALGTTYGRLLEQLQTDYVGSPLPNSSDNSWSDVFRSEALSLASQSDNRFSDLRGRLHGVFDDFSVDASGDTSLLHLDYWWENVLFNESGTSVTGVIDWGWTLSGPPALGIAVAEFLTVGSNNWEQKNVTSESLREMFRQGVLSEYTPTVTATEWQYYQLYARCRALRGFPYWYRDATTSEKKKLESQLRDEVNTLLGANSITPIPGNN